MKTLKNNLISVNYDYTESTLVIELSKVLN